MEKVYGVVNKVRSEDEKNLVLKVFERYGIKVLGFVPHDDTVYTADKYGYAPIDYKPDCNAVKAIRGIALKLLVDMGYVVPR